MSTVAPVPLPRFVLPVLESVVNAPVLGTLLPIGVPLILPPVITALAVVSVSAVIPPFAVSKLANVLAPATLNAPPMLVAELALPIVVVAVPEVLIAVTPLNVFVPESVFTPFSALVPLTLKEFVVMPLLAFNKPPKLIGSLTFANSALGAI